MLLVSISYSVYLSFWVTFVAPLTTRLPDLTKGFNTSFHPLAVLMSGERELRKANAPLSRRLAVLQSLPSLNTPARALV